MGGLYDLWGRAKALLRGERFEAEHGAVVRKAEEGKAVRKAGVRKTDGRKAARRAKGREGEEP